MTSYSQSHTRTPSFNTTKKRVKIKYNIKFNKIISQSPNSI